MTMSNWFTMEGPSKQGAMVVEYLGTVRDAGRVLRGEESVESPMHFRHYMGGRVYDWIPSSHVALQLISGRMECVLREGGFTGWHTIPATIRHKKLGELDGYGCLVVTGCAGCADSSKGRLEQRPSHFANGRPRVVHVGLHVELSEWDGSDILIPGCGIRVLVSRAVRDALVEAKMTGMYFTRLDEYEVDDSEATQQLWKEMGLV